MNDSVAALTSFEPGAMAPEGSIPLCVPTLRGNEWKYVKECLDTNWVSSVGPFVDQFESMVAAYADSNHAVATASGTAALHIALLVAGVEPDDEVLVPSLTFIAPANAVRYAGAWPVFIDAEPDYWQMDASLVRAFLRDGCTWSDGHLYNKTTGRRVSAVLPVHILGHPVDIDPIMDVAREFSLPVIEDATESLGAQYKGRKVGHLGDLACFSFNGNKVITTGGGGMLVTDNAEWMRRARYLTTQAKDDPIEYMHREVGFNYRLTNIQSALGCAQMELLDSFVARKRDLAARYTSSFSNIPGITPMRQAEWARSSCWMYTVLVNEHEYGRDSRALLNHLSAAGIQARPLWQPLHQSPAYPQAQVCGGAIAERLNALALTLPSSVGLTESDQTRVIDAVAGVSK